MSVGTFSVRADRDKGWRFCGIWILVSAPLVAAFCGLAVAVEEIEAADFLLVWLLGVAVMALYGLSFACGWLRTSATTEYAVDESSLTVRRRGAIVVAIPREAVDEFEMLGTMDLRHCLTDVAPPPEWPSGHVWFHDGHAKRQTALPEIMIWGAQERARVEAEMRRALGLTPRRVPPTAPANSSSSAGHERDQHDHRQEDGD